MAELKKEAYFFRLNISECIKNAFNEVNMSSISFPDILVLCTGESYNMIIRFYR